MDNDHSYIKLFRKMLTWGWYGDTNTVRVFLHILLRANHKPGEYLGHPIGAGECVFGYNAWSEELGLSVRQLRTAITHLKSTNEIVVRTTNRFSIITVVKWEFWQIEEGEPTNDRQATRQTSDTQATTSKEYKNISTTTINKGRPNSVEEVRAYVAEKGLSVDPDYFWEYYEDAEWKDVKGKPVKNWKLKARTWSNREKERNGDKHGDGSERINEASEQRASDKSGDGRDRTERTQSWYIPEVETLA